MVLGSMAIADKQQSSDLYSTLQHVAIIMDGNGRWAKQKNQLRMVGHRAGLKTVRKIVQHASEKGLKALTLYAFSSENWKRPETEVSALMSLFVYALNKEVKTIHKNNIRLRVIGDTSKFSMQIQNMIEKSEKLTSQNTGLTLNIAANYGGRWDIVNAVKNLAEQVQRGSLFASDITEEMLESKLCMSDLPAVDLVIRTGGEYRISNFLLWQSAYSEFYFTDVLWPDFDQIQFEKALNSFNNRERRFGGILVKDVPC